MTLMTKGAYAVHRGVGKSAVSNWAKKDLLVMGECPSSGAIMVDVERTDARINSRIDPMRGRPTNGQPSPTVVAQAEPVTDLLDMAGGRRNAAQVRVDLAEEQLIDRRMKNAEAARELAPRIELERRAAELGRVARERMHAMWRSNAERLAAETDPRTIMSIGIAEIDRVFAQLADDADSGALAADDDETADDAAIEREVEEQIAEA